MRHLAIVLLALLLTVCASAASEEPPWYSDLAERSRPGSSGERTTDPFRDLLRLRDAPEPGAAEVLAQVVADHEGSSRIHRYAATQALSTIGTKEADELLERCVTVADFDGRLAFDYAFHWDMKPRDRDRYLQRFVLRNVGVAPTLEARAATAAEDAKHWLEVEVVLRNATDREMRLLDPSGCSGRMLVFRSAAGHVERAFYPATCEFMGAGAMTLAPGDSLTVTIRVSRPEPVHRSMAKMYRLDPDGLIATVGSYHFAFAGPGRYEVLARWTSSVGRSVSAPVAVTVPAPR
jgi:hypothetical protein